MRLSDYRGEEALDVFADILEPMTEIITDEEIVALTKQKGTPVMAFVKPAIKNHKKAIIAILARLENKPVEEYVKTLTLFTLPKQVLDLFNDPEVQSLFHSQTQTDVKSEASFGSAMENTEAKES